MPKRRGIDVHVTDTKSNAFTEYGLQSDRRFTSDKSRVSTFIEAKTGVQFLIEVTVDNPFMFDEDLDPVARLAAAVQGQLPASQAQKEHNTRTKHFDANRPTEEEVRGCVGVPPAVTKVPFDLMVSVFIDGHAKPECRQMIYLDPSHPRYHSRCVLKGRWVDPGDAASRRGKAGLLQWVFADRGIDHLLEQLDVNRTLDQASTNLDEADIEAVRDRLGEDMFEDREDKRMKAGQIEVCLRRVISIEDGSGDQKFRPYHFAGSDEKPREVGDDCTHTTSFVPKASSTGPSKIETFALRHVPWAFYKNGEDFWQKFVFNYTARHKLVNLGLSGADGKPTLMGRMQQPEPGPSSKRGKKRASSVGGVDSDEEVLPKKPRGKKVPKAAQDPMGMRSGHESDSSVSEEDPDDTAAFYSGQRSKYELRATRARVDNFVKSKVEDDADQIS